MRLQPTHVVIGTTDPDATTRFLRAFGFQPAGREALDARTARALYGLEADTEEWTLAVEGASRGWIRLVQTPLAASAAGPFALGPHAIDLYTRDIDRSLGLARETGARCGPVGTYSLGPMVVREAQAVGPDHVVVVFIEIAKRRPSVLDTDPARLHSEVHAGVWTVDDPDAALAFWCREAGLQSTLDATFREPQVSVFMELPRPDVPLRLAVLADEVLGPPRFELIAFPDDRDVRAEAWPLRGGLHALGADADDVEAAMAALPSVRWGAVVSLSSGGRAVSGEAPGGIRLELRG